MNRKQIALSFSAPGKIHLMGEHAVVFGKPALLAAIAMRCVVKLTSLNENTIIISSKNLKKTTSYSREEITALTQGDLPTLAVGETLNYFAMDLPSGFAITIDSEIPMGSGLGSSAATAVSITSAVMVFLTKKFDKKKVNEIAFTVEKNIHRNPSGGDNTICCYGGIIVFQKGKMLQSTVTIAKKFTQGFLLIDSGKPVETTGEMINFVRKFQKENKSMFAKFLSDQEQITEKMIKVLQNGSKEELMNVIKRGEGNLEKIGVVSDAAKALIALVEKNGGAAKISGAGGNVNGSGMLLAYHPQKESLKQIFLSRQIPFYDVVLGGEGLRSDL